MRRRGEVRLVGDAAARVEAHRARLEPGAQAGGEVARGAVVAGDDDRRADRDRARAAPRAGTGRSDCETNARPPSRQQRGGLGIVVGVSEERAEHAPV